MIDNTLKTDGFPSDEKTMRLFAAIVPGMTEIEQLSHALNLLKSEQWAGKIRWIPSENIHMTLRFFGDTDEAQYRCLLDAMRSSIVSSPSFDVSLSHVLCLPSISKTRVIAVGVNSDSRLSHLATQVEKIARTCGFDAEKRRFLGHFTIGRCKHLDFRNTIIPQNTDGMRIRIKSVELIRSILSPSGSVYKTIESFPLNP